MGSGDRALACAAVGRAEDAVVTLHLNEARTRHYLPWATRLTAAVGGRVGVLDGALFHLWHGELSFRGYAERHRAFADFQFDPARDLIYRPGRPLEWSPTRPDLEAFARKYFESRREDGAHTDATSITAPWSVA